MVVRETLSAGQADEPALPVDGHHLGSHHADIVVEGLLVKVPAAVGVATVEEGVGGAKAAFLRCEEGRRRRGRRDGRGLGFLEEEGAGPINKDA